MSPDQLNDRFRQAAAHAPEITLAEATERFLNPQPLPPPARPWYLNPYFMLTILLSVLAFVFFPGATPPDALSNAFPIEASESPAEPVFALPGREYPLTFNRELPAGGAIVPAPLLQPVAAPAAAPPEELTESTPSDPVRVSPLTGKTDLTSPAPAKNTAAVPVNGTWEIRKKTLFLTVLVNGESGKTGYNLLLTEEEIASLKDPNNRPASIFRPTGTIILLDGRHDGGFEFLPDASFRKGLNASGLGDASFRMEDLPDDGLIGRAYSDVRSAESPREIIWLKYFLTGIDDAYVQRLRDFGYTNAELQDLWHLANAEITPSILSDILDTATKLFTDRPPLKHFRQLRRLAATGKGRYFSDQPKMPYAEFREQHLIRTTDASRRPVPPYFLMPMDIDSLIIIKTPGVGDVELPDNWGLATPGRTVDTLTYGNQRFLKAKGRIRVLLDDELPTNIVLIYKTPAADLSFRMGNRTLKISNDCGDEVVDIAVNKAAFRGITTARCAEFLMEIKQKRKGIK